MTAYEHALGISPLDLIKQLPLTPPPLGGPLYARWYCTRRPGGRRVLLVNDRREVEGDTGDCYDEGNAHDRMLDEINKVMAKRRERQTSLSEDFGQRVKEVARTGGPDIRWHDHQAEAVPS